VDLQQSSNPRAVIDALRERENHSSALVREHVEWALNRHQNKDSGF